MRPNKSILIKNIPFLLSAFALVALRMISLRAMVIPGISWLILLGLSPFRPLVSSDWKKNSNFITIAAAIFFAEVVSYLFDSDVLQVTWIPALSQKLGPSGDIWVALIARIGMLCSLYCLCVVSAWLFAKLKLTNEPTPSLAQNRHWDLPVCFLTAIGVITICSKSSPLYPLNDWVDANCFFTVGKSMLSGVLPYRDLFEQKGPLLYMLHALAALVDYRGFLGVYLMEILSCTAFLYQCRKLLLLYHSDSSLLWIPVIAALVYSSYSFLHGDSAEELCLPLVFFSLYCILRSLKNGTPLSFRDGFFLGITAAAVLWIKFTLLGIYIGLFLAFVILKLRESKPGEIGMLVLSVSLGAVVLTVPIFAYFLYHNALTDLFTVYFYDNLFLYPAKQTHSFPVRFAASMVRGFVSVNVNNLLPNLVIFLGLVGFFRTGRKKEFFMLLTALASLFFFVYLGGLRYPYYAFIHNAFAPIGILFLEESAAPLLRKFRDSRRARQQLLSAGLFAVCLAFAFFRCNNANLIGVPKEALPQYQFAQIIQQKENATLLNYRFLDGGFYTTSGIVPHCRSFCRTNLSMEELDALQDQYIQDGLTDFVVTRGFPLEDEKYICVAESSHVIYGETFYYFLYQKLPISLDQDMQPLPQ